MNPKYRKMLRIMEAKEKKTRPGRRRVEQWFRYILRCSDGSFYTGITKDVARRFQAHNAGKASRFTRAAAGQAALSGKMPYEDSSFGPGMRGEGPSEKEKRSPHFVT